jgi:hypothetical protein
MKRALAAFGLTAGKTYLGFLLIVVYVFPATFVFTTWALVATSWTSL